MKQLTRVVLDDLIPAPLRSVSPVAGKKLVHNLKATGGFVPDKVKGFSGMENGRVFRVTDDDRMDDHVGGTLFLKVTRLRTGTACFHND